MREEGVTMAIASWLRHATWHIHAIDYPGRGSGLVIQATRVAAGPLAPGAWRPDIVASRNGRWVFFENKAQFDEGDFRKVRYIRSSSAMINATRERLSIPSTDKLFFGVGFADDPTSVSSAGERASWVDFVVVATSLSPPSARVISQPPLLFS